MSAAEQQSDLTSPSNANTSTANNTASTTTTTTTNSSTTEHDQKPESIAMRSIAMHADKSYYYWHDKVSNTVPIVPPQLVRVEKVDVGTANAIPTTQISAYIWYDDEQLVKVVVEFEGVGALPKEHVTVSFETRQVKLTIKSADEKKLHVLFLSPLAHDIAADTSSYFTKANKLTLKLRKQDKETHWYDLLSNKPLNSDD